MQTLLGVSSLLHFECNIGFTSLSYFAGLSGLWLNILGLAACGILGLAVCGILGTTVKQLLPLVRLHTTAHLRTRTAQPPELL